jgi:hypothetical protein
MLNKHTWLRVCGSVACGDTPTLGYGATDAIEFSLTYSLPKSPIQVTVNSLWKQWWVKAEPDQIRLPTEIHRNRLCYTRDCLTENQEVHIIVKQRLDDGFQPAIPEGTQKPRMIVYGANAVTKLRRTDRKPRTGHL